MSEETVEEYVKRRLTEDYKTKLEALLKEKFENSFGVIIPNDPQMVNVRIITDD